MNRVICNKLGFTLVEVLIAIAVLGVFIIPISGMFVSSLRASESSRVSIEAYSIANRVIEAMGESEVSVPYKSELLSLDEYNLYNINKAYEVKKTIEIIENEKMNSFVDLEKLSNDGTLLNIDASRDGQLSFINALISQLTYSPSFAPDVSELTIDFDDSSIKNANTVIAYKNFDYIRVIGGNSNLKLILNNKSSTDKTLYTVDTSLNSTFSVETMAASKSQWISYDNLSITEKNETGSVATANISITVRHIATNKGYTVTTKRVFYKYEN